MRLLPLALFLVLAVAGACTGEAPGRRSASGAVLDNGSFTADLGGFRIHYEVHGRGPVLMTVPNSWGLSLQGLRVLYRPLEERLTVVYFDPRGMGGSGPVRSESDRGMEAVRSDFQALRAHLKLEKVNAIGWSNGAINLVWLAAERPETLSSAVFVHGLASFTAADGKELQAKHPELMKSFARLEADVSKPGLTEAEQTARQRKVWLGEYFPTLVADRARASEIVGTFFRDAQLSWPHAAYAAKETQVFDARDRLARITVPSLVIAGAHDLLPPSLVKALADGIPGSKFLVFERSGHFAPLEEASAFAAAVEGFVGATPPTGR